jgi:GST-like protein
MGRAILELSDKKHRRGVLMTLSLYTWATPNGHKPQILLEELAVPYEVKPVNIFKGEQLTDEFRLINPNRRIPVLVDSSNEGGPPFRVFESGAILLYLAEKYGRFLPSGASGRLEAIQWVMWQMGGLGPMLGQGQHFWTYATEKHPYAIERYTKEGHRLLDVMDWHLGQHEYLADEYSIADIACFPWVRIHKLANLSIENFPNVARWYGAIRTRPAVTRGLNVLRDQLTGVPNTKEAHDVVFGKTQFREADAKLAGKGTG